MNQALNAARMKRQNHRKFLEMLRPAPMTRARLAAEMGLTRAAAGLIAEELLVLGVIGEGPARTGDGRVAAKALHWNPAYAHLAGVHLGRDRITAGLGDFCGGVLDADSFPVSACADAEDALDRASRLLERMLAARRPAGRLLGVGVASPGPLDREEGRVLDPPHFALFHNAPVANRLRQRFGCAVTLENDADALALAELRFGLGRQCGRFLVLLVEQGVGGALVLDGRLHRGPAGLGNGFGHTCINLGGPRCACGNVGCVELYAAIPRIEQAARRLDPALTGWRTIVDRANMGDRTALDMLDSEAHYLSTVIVNASNLLDIRAVALAGEDVLYRPGLLLESACARVAQRISSRDRRSVEVLPSRLPQPRLLACTNLVVERFLEQPPPPA